MPTRINKPDSRFDTGHIILLIRARHGFTQKQLAKKTGLLQSSISRAEAYGCSLEYLYKIAEKTGDTITITLNN